MDGGQASIVVQNLKGEQFTMNFMSDYINATSRATNRATSRAVEASLEGDSWTVIIAGEEEYRVPLAAIDGG